MNKWVPFFILLLCMHDFAFAVFTPQKPRAENSKKNSIAEKEPLNLSLKSMAMIQNSTGDWNDQVVEVVEIYEDGSIRVKKGDGSKAYIRAKNIPITLSPEVDCGISHDVNLCKGDEVYFPNQSISLGIPTAKIKYIFKNGKAVLKDGANIPFQLRELGKESNCSPQKPNICTGAFVLGEGYRNNEPYSFSGKVLKTYTNGLVIVARDRFWNFTIDANSVNARIASTEEEENRSVITVRGNIKDGYVLPEIEPGNAIDADKAQVDRGI